MRMTGLILAAFSFAGAAQAASVDVLKLSKSAASSSVETIKCDSCVRPAVKKVETGPELAPGTQKVEIRDINGVKKIYRTEAWLGGSPIVFVTKVPESELAKMAAAKADLAPADTAAVEVEPADVASPAMDMIDESAKTSAVTADVGAVAKVEPKPAAFDAGTLELRVD